MLVATFVFQKNHTFMKMRIQDIIQIDKEILSGQPVFLGTRVPVDTLFDHLEIVNKMLTSQKANQLYEALA
jgi:uncharacterized protein (DUF433 family)